MSLKHILIALLTCFICLFEAIGGPVRYSQDTYTQPDGTSFDVNVSGDEWIRIRKTADGCAIVKGEDGWWYYGIYDSEGRLSSSGYAVGKNASADIISRSRQIPYRRLSENAARYRKVNRGTINQIESIRRHAIMTKGSDSKIQKKGIVLLVQFNDTKFKYTKADFEAMLNSPNYNGTGSAKDYYEQQFGEGWEFTFDVSDIITLNWPVKHYGENDSMDQDIRPWDMVVEACQQADKMGVDFAQYDQDGDNVVDNIYVFYAGKSEAENTDKTELIWPHSYYIYSGEEIQLQLDGKWIDRYACSAEISGDRSLTGIGSFCHEYGHTFDLVDLYDTDYDEAGGWAAGTWNSTSVMDGGSYNNNSATPPYFNCIEREMLGISTSIPIEQDKSYTLEPIHSSNTFYRLDSGKEGEYYLFECRSNDGWDSHIGGKGMLVYHIDKIKKEKYGIHEQTTWEWNSVNATQSHQCADLIEADGRSDLIRSMSDLYRNIKGIFYPQSKVTAIEQFNWWYSPATDITITGITASGNNVSFKVGKATDVVEVAKVTNASFTTFPDAAIIMFDKNDPNLDGKPSLRWKQSGTENEYKDGTVVEYVTGKYACKLTGLQSGNVSYETKIRFEAESNIGDEYKLSFMTKRNSAVTWPYLYISDYQITKGNGIPLHIVNSAEAAEVQWEYGGMAVSPEKDGHFYPTASGDLKATVIWEDGSKDIIIKRLEVVE
jgi:M6 family metalloprotease-like protein